MTKSEWEALTRAFAGGPIDSDVEGLLRALLESGVSLEGEAARLFGALEGPDTGGSMSRAPTGTSARATAVAEAGEGEAQRTDGSTVLKTMGMVTGVGPLVTGMVKLFGGGGDRADEALYSPIPYSLPEQISVEGGLAQDRSFVDIGYSGRGQVRAMPATAPAQIQINVNAMDSRSFADHSDEIARAVRDAMLRSHTLNDVIAEM